MEDKIFDKLVSFLEKREVLHEMDNKKNYNGLSLSEVHCIEDIEKLDGPNVTNISKKMNMTRGGITKLTVKLVKKGYIEKFSIEGNKKEVHFRLTEEGKKIYLKHEKIHEEARYRETKFLGTFKSEEKKVINNFLKKLNEHTDKLIKGK